MDKGGFRQVDLAAATGVHRKTIGDWLQESLANPLKYERVVALADLFRLKGEDRKVFFEDLGYPHANFEEDDLEETGQYLKSILLIFDERIEKDKRFAQKLTQQLKQVYRVALYDEALFKAQVQAADCTLAIISPETKYNESFKENIGYVYKITQTNHTHLMAVAQQEVHDIPQDLSNILLNITVIDTQVLLKEFDEVINIKLKISTQPYELELASGAMPLDSKFYIERQANKAFAYSFKRKDPTILIKGPRQVGKTSLLVRGLQLAREANYVTVFTDFQKLNLAKSNDIPLEKQQENFFLALGSLLAMQLQLETYPHETWLAYLTANANFDLYIRQHILRKTDKHVLWVMDEVDRILAYPFSDEVFSLLRSWHSDRNTNPDDPCKRLSLVLSYSSEPYLFIKDLNHRYGSPLYQGELEDFLKLIGGQPYLTRAALNEMVTHNLSFSALLKHLEQNQNALSDHLKRLSLLLAQNQDLTQAIQQLFSQRTIASHNDFLRLHSAGVVVGTQERPRFRCQLYENYLRNSLGTS